MQVFLPDAIAAKGGSVKLKIEFSFIAPNEGSDRMGVLETKMERSSQWHNGILVCVCTMMFADGIQIRI